MPPNPIELNTLGILVIDEVVRRTNRATLVQTKKFGVFSIKTLEKLIDRFIHDSTFGMMENKFHHLSIHQQSRSFTTRLQIEAFRNFSR